MGSVVCGMQALVEAQELSSCGMWDLSSLSRDRTCVPLHCKVDSLPLNHQGSPWIIFLMATASVVVSDPFLILVI